MKLNRQVICPNTLCCWSDDTWLTWSSSWACNCSTFLWIFLRVSDSWTRCVCLALWGRAPISAESPCHQGQRQQKLTQILIHPYGLLVILEVFNLFFLSPTLYPFSFPAYLPRELQLQYQTWKWQPHRNHLTSSHRCTKPNLCNRSL